MTKSTKSHLRGLSSLLKNSSRVHELVARAVRGECVRQRIKRKSAVLRSPQSKLYHACEHIARDSRADSCTHCLHARIIRWAGVDGVSTLTEQSDKHYKHLIRQPTAATFSHWRRLRDAELFLKKSATHKKIIAFQMAQRKMV